MNVANKETVYNIKVQVTGDAALRKLQNQVASLNSAAVKINKAAPSIRSTGGAFSGMGNQVQNASYQIQDFIVQVTGGQDAMRAFGQQAPQLLGAFGAVGAAVGVVAALMPAVVSAFGNAAKDADDAAKSVESLSDAISELSNLTRNDFLLDVARNFGDISAQSIQAQRNLEQFNEAVAFNRLTDSADTFRKAVVDAFGALSFVNIQDTVFGALNPSELDAQAAALDDLFTELGKLTSGFSDMTEGQETAVRAVLDLRKEVAELQKLQKAGFESGRVNIYEAETESLRQINTALRGGLPIREAETRLAQQKFEFELASQNLSDLEVQRLTERRNLELERLDIIARRTEAQRISDSNNREAIQRMQTAIKSVTSPTQAAQEQFAALNEAIENFGHLLSPEQLAEAYLGLEKLATEADLLGKTWKTSLTDNLDAAFKNMIDGTKSASQAFGDMAKNILADVAQMIIRMQVLGPLMQSLGLANPYGTNTFGSAGAATTNALGGVVGGLSSYRGSLVGEAGPEAILPLRRMSSGRMGVEAKGGDTVVNVINNTPAQATVTESVMPGGGREIQVMIDNQVQQSMARGVYDRTMGAAFGLQRRGQGGR